MSIPKNKIASPPKELSDEIPFESVCEHPKEMQYIRVHSVCVTCETTTIACRACGTDLTEPKTEC